MERLPIDPHLPAFLGELRARGAMVLVADPGSGKTTRVPPAILDAGLAGDGEIVVLEPRRLATRLAARRVAAERGEAVGETVGYQVRFEEVASRRTRIRFVTEGILARRLVSDPTLLGVSVVIADEVHERHLAGDLALAFVAALRRGARPDLKVVAMSATLDAGPVAEFLGAGAMRVEAPRFPVEIEYADRPDERPLARQVAGAVARLRASGPAGSVLVFLPGAGEIRRAAEALAAGPVAPEFEVALLHGDLPPADQERAIAPGTKPKVILSTNVAESSVTVPGVVAVIDSGLARIARHSPWSGLASREVGRISRAAAAQRAGRAGRLAPGRAVRLYTKHDHDTRPAADLPEVARTDLAETLLALRAAGIDPARFGWFEPPPAAALASAERLLGVLGAVDAAGEPTALGRRMLDFPLHPRLARLMLEADARGAGREGALAAALLGEREILVAARTRFGAGEVRREASGDSDLVERMELFGAVERIGLSADRLRAHGFDVGAAFAVAKGRDQLLRALRPGKGTTGDPTEAILLATAAAFVDRLARRRARRSPELVPSGGGSARLDGASVVRESEWLVMLDAEERKGEPALVRLASATSPEALVELFPDRLAERKELRFEAEIGRVEEIETLELDGTPLETTRRPASGPAAEALLARAAQEAGPARFCESEELERFRVRVEFAAGHGAAVPPIDDEALAAALAELAVGKASFGEMATAGLLSTLAARLGGAGRAAVERLAPERVALPGGRSAKVEWDRHRPPSVSSRLQDFFGQREGPRVAGGAVPLVLRLLAPNQREVQVTSDLAGFWERHYPALRRELSRRYPRHSWPDDPLSASPPAPRRR